MDCAYIDLDYLVSIYHFKDIDKHNRKEYVIISKDEYLNLQSAKKHLDEIL